MKFSRYASARSAAIGYDADDLVTVARGHGDDVALQPALNQSEIIPDFLNLFPVENYAFRGAPAKLEDDSLLANLLTVFNPIDCDWNPKQLRQDVRRCLVADGGLNLAIGFVYQFFHLLESGREKTELSVLESGKIG